MRQFVDSVRASILKATSSGYSCSAILVSPEGEKVIMHGFLKERCDDVELGGEGHVSICGVPVKARKVPTGHVWYVYKGGKS